MNTQPSPSARRVTWYVDQTAWRVELHRRPLVVVPVRDSHRDVAAGRLPPEPAGRDRGGVLPPRWHPVRLLTVTVDVGGVDYPLR